MWWSVPPSVRHPGQAATFRWTLACASLRSVTKAIRVNVGYWRQASLSCDPVARWLFPRLRTRKRWRSTKYCLQEERISSSLPMFNQWIQWGIPSQEASLPFIRIDSCGFVAELRPVRAGIRIMGKAIDTPKSKRRRFLTETATV